MLWSEYSLMDESERYKFINIIDHTYYLQSTEHLFYIFRDF